MPLIYMALIATYAMQHKSMLITISLKNMAKPACLFSSAHGHTFVNKYLITAGRTKTTALVCKLLLKNMCLYCS